MKNLYDKIYKAVNEGIQKALLINPLQNDDVSINYSYHKIDNYADPLLMEMEFIDLGLPSGTLWCKHNIGATCEKDDVSSWYGDYYAWGELEPNKLNFNKKYNWENYKFSDKKGKIFSRYNTKSKYGDIDNLTVLISDDDIVNVEYTKKYQNSRMAKKVKMPTKEQCEELKNCYNEWATDYNGVKGLNGRIFAGYNGNTLFIPAAGYFIGSELYLKGSYCALWSSSLYSNKPYRAWCLKFGNDIRVDYTSCCYGLSVRGVCS